MKPDTQTVYPGDRFAYSQDVITRLHERAESYRQSGPSAGHTADLLDEAAGAISALIEKGVHVNCIYPKGAIIPVDEAIAYGLKAVAAGGLDWSDLEDDIVDAISDSMDMDWSSRDGAKAVVALLMKIGGRQ